MKIDKKSSFPTWKLALIGAGTSIGIAGLGLGGWYLSTQVLPEISSSSSSKKPSDGLFLTGDSCEKYGFIDKTGKMVIGTNLLSELQAKLEDNGYRCWVEEFHDGFARVDARKGSSRDGYPPATGYFDKSGKLAIAPQFESARNFSEGVAFVKLGSKWGLINKEGKIIINPQFDESGDFSEGLAQVKIGDKWGYIDKKGNMVIQPTFNRAGSFESELAYFQPEKNSKWGYIGKTGKVVIEPKFDFPLSFSEDLAAIAIDDKWGYIDKQGNVVIKPRFSLSDGNHVDTVNSNFSEGLAAVIENGKKFYIDKTGKTVIAFQIDKHKKFSEGLAVVEIGNKCGYIDKVGKIVINPQFASCESFSQGLAKVTDPSGYSGYIDQSGKFVWKSSPSPQG
jgi:WG containing repeat